MTPRETMIEAITRALLWNAWPIPEGKIDSDFFDLMKKANPEWWAINQQDATTALDALLAALPGLGLKVVPVEATAKMANAAVDRTGAGGDMSWRNLSPQHLFREGHIAMLAATLDVLEGEK